MNVCKRLWTALENLADSLTHMSQTVYAVSGDVRQRAGIEVIEGTGLPVIASYSAMPALDQSPRNGHAETPVKAGGRRAK